MMCSLHLWAIHHFCNHSPSYSEPASDSGSPRSRFRLPAAGTVKLPTAPSSSELHHEMNQSFGPRVIVTIGNPRIFHDHRSLASR
jgi:hypothetical protein